uniref:Pannexin 3 n=1 Tax=Leptobrachium leishanense TaxID=445787 RepID=A0A8C5QPB7_9ANUR
MYVPVALWKYISRSLLSSDLLFIVDELDKSYNRSIKLVQHLVKAHRTSTDPLLFWEELKSARHVRYFEFPLLERYLTCKQQSHRLVFAYLLRNVVLLVIILVTCSYLAIFHLTVFYQDEFTCHIREGFLRSETPSSMFINCKFVSLSIFQIVSVANAIVYVLLVPIILYNVSKLCYWDKQFLNVYEMLPAFDLLTKKMLGCPVNDLNVLILFLRANISEIKSFSRLSVLCTLKDTTKNSQNIDTVVDFMTLLVGMDIENGTMQNNGACGGNSDAVQQQSTSKKECYEMGKIQEKK